MQIIFSPQRRDDTLTVTKQGDALTINGTEYDFGIIPDGATLPKDATDCPWLASEGERINGVLHLSLILPNSEDASEAARFPDPLINPADGSLPLPDQQILDFTETKVGVIDVDAVILPPQTGEVSAARLAATQSAIMDERNRRMRDTLAFGGHVFDIDQGSLQRITGAATLAGFALGQGAQAGDLFWHGGDAPFGWITADNQIVTMDAPTVFAFGQAAANHESQHIFAARALKDMDPIPNDWADDKWWP